MTTWIWACEPLIVVIFGADSTSVFCCWSSARMSTVNSGFVRTVDNDSRVSAGKKPPPAPPVVDDSVVPNCCPTSVA